MGLRTRLVLIVGGWIGLGLALAWLWGVPGIARLVGERGLSAGLSPADSAIAAEIARVAGSRLLVGLTAFGLALVAIVWLAAEFIVRRQVQSLTRLTLDVQRNAAPASEAPRHGGALGSLEKAIGQLASAYHEQGGELRAEQRRRADAEASLREKEERYALAVRCANEGLWEWNLRSNDVYFAPNWKRLIGYGEDEIATSPTEWTDRLHPEDKPAVLEALNAHLRGESPQFEHDFRMRCKDGSYRWFLGRGRLIESATGKPYKFIGLNADITARKRTQQILEGMDHGLSASRGEDFFQALVRNLATTMGLPLAFVTEVLDQPPTRVRTLAWWQEGGYQQNFEYDLAGTPCDKSISTGEIAYFRTGLYGMFPPETMRGFEQFDSYIGIPFFGHDGKVIGHIAVEDTGPMEDDLPRLPIFRIFGVCAAAELEYRRLQPALGATPATGPGPTAR